MLCCSSNTCCLIISVFSQGMEGSTGKSTVMQMLSCWCSRCLQRTQGQGRPCLCMGAQERLPGNSQKSSLQDHPLEMRLKGWAQQFLFSPPSSFSLFYLLLSFFPPGFSTYPSAIIKKTPSLGLFSLQLASPFSTPCYCHTPWKVVRVKWLQSQSFWSLSVVLFYFIFFFFAVAGLCCCASASSSCSEQGNLLSSCNV